MQQLLDEMDAIVSDYHPDVGRTGRNVTDLIQGTAFFPGGCGLWRGGEPRGAMPEYFPEEPVMLVAHNFDSITSYENSKAKGGEVQSSFWDKVVRIVQTVRIDPSEAFYTNRADGR